MWSDVHVSGQIQREGAWEYETVNNVVIAMRKFERATFLGKDKLKIKKLKWSNMSDIGANIGMYALVIAAMKRQVVAVDADPNNLAYIRKSLNLSQTTEYVRIVYNSVR